MNGVDYTGRAGVPFMYYNVSQVAIATMRPSGGRRSGGTLVRLRGTSFVDYGGAAWGPKCRFGDLVVRATLVSHEEVRCVSPATELPEGTDVPYVSAASTNAACTDVEVTAVVPCALRCDEPAGLIMRDGDIAKFLRKISTLVAGRQALLKPTPRRPAEVFASCTTSLNRCLT